MTMTVENAKTLVGHLQLPRTGGAIAAILQRSVGLYMASYWLHPAVA